jgi:hypothetical protein
MSVINLTYSRYFDLFETPVPLARIEQTLSTFRLSDVLFQLARINILLAKSRIEDCADQTQKKLIEIFFDEDIIQRINEKYAGKVESPPTFFFRLQILTLMRVCARVCSESAEREIRSRDDAKDFGRCCLWITDYLETEDEVKAITEGSVEEQRRALAPQLATSFEFYYPTDIARAVARADALFSEVVKSPEVIRQSGSFDLPSALLTTTGLTIEQFFDLIFLVFTWFYAHDVEELFDDPSLCIITPSIFIRRTTVDTDSFDKLLRLISMPIDRLSENLSLSSNSTIHHNFTAISSCPLTQLTNGNIICIDFDYLVEKLNTGVYWLIVDHFDGLEKAKAQGAFGYVFQEYINRMFRSVYRVSSRILSGHFTANPKYKNKPKEAFDGMLLSTNNPYHLFVFQYKSQFIKPAIKYGGSVDDIEREINEECAN